MSMAAADPWYTPWVDLLSVVGFPLALWGLWLTWKQARDAADSAKAATAAVKRTQRQLRANQLLVLIPQLRWIANELDASILAEETALAKKYLDNWRFHASNVRGILNAADSSQYELLQEIQQSVGLAAAAGSGLMANGNGPLHKRCTKARASIGHVCDQLGAWVGENASQVPGGDEDDE
ncbi:hypothetical protein ACQPZK_25405 [Micromonospora sp. CA-249363]|uniref:hypothetical protein n=1 Tax=Micromonospora sp. CA-249363 TaxID=3239963 RepID=UPI003D8CF3E5